MPDYRGIRYRLYPNKKQEVLMNHFLDSTRKVYNRLLEICISFKNHGISLPSEFDLIRMATKIRQRNPWMQDVHSNCFQTVANRVYKAFVSWKKRYKEGVGFPRFKSWKMFDSFTYNSGSYFSFVGKNGEKEKRERLRLGKIGLLKYSNPLVFTGERKTATVFRRKVGNHFEWYVTISYKNEGYMKDSFSIDSPSERVDIGIDLGLDNIITLSNGIEITNDHDYRKKEEMFAKMQKKMMEVDKTSPDYQKLLSKITHKYKKLRNHRSDMFHKITRQLSEHYRNVCMEDIAVKDFVEKSSKGMRKSFRDASWGIFTRMLSYKVGETGNKIVFVNPAYTSQLCSSCGVLVPKDLSVRVHNCPNCGLVMSRDQNAALNILNRGLGLQTEAGNSLKRNEG